MRGAQADPDSLAGALPADGGCRARVEPARSARQRDSSREMTLRSRVVVDLCQAAATLKTLPQPFCSVPLLCPACMPTAHKAAAAPAGGLPAGNPGTHHVWPHANSRVPEDLRGHETAEKQKSDGSPSAACVQNVDTALMWSWAPLPSGSLVLVPRSAKP